MSKRRQPNLRGVIQPTGQLLHISCSLFDRMPTKNRRHYNNIVKLLVFVMFVKRYSTYDMIHILHGYYIQITNGIIICNYDELF